MLNFRRVTAVATVVAAAAVPTAALAMSGGLPSPGAASTASASGSQAWVMPSPLVIGHRGASGYLPDHTLASYGLAIELGADCIEPDLVSTSDGVLVARHEPNLIATTDVAEHPEFADRFTTEVVDGLPQDGWFASDFTLAEIKSLHAIQPLAERFEGVDGDFTIPTFAEVIGLAQRKSSQEGRTICIVPETKHPTYHQQLGLPLEDKVVEALEKVGWNDADDPVFIQSFEQANLQYLDTVTDAKLVQLIDANGVDLDGTVDSTGYRPYDWELSGRDDDYTYLVTPQGLAEVATYADAIGPWKPYLISTAGTDLDGDGVADDVNDDGVVDERDRTLLPPSDVVDDAHAEGLLVTPFTFRDEQYRLAADYAGEPAAEYRTFYELGVDGLFSDFASTAFAARAEFLLDHNPALAQCLAGVADSPDRCIDIAPPR